MVELRTNHIMPKMKTSPLSLEHLQWNPLYKDTPEMRTALLICPKGDQNREYSRRYLKINRERVKERKKITYHLDQLLP